MPPRWAVLAWRPTGHMYQPTSEQSGGHFPTSGAADYGPGYHAVDTQQVIDNEQLRLLRVGYFISAAYTAIFIPVGILYAGMGVMMTRLPSGHGAPPPAMFTWIFGAIGVSFTLFAVVGAGLKLLTAIRLKERRSRVLCLIVAGLSCLEIPYGTALGVMTFVVLGRASVQRLFDS
jgi:hypothetical protein